MGSRALSPAPHKCQLPGRTLWIDVCHVEPAECAECLRSIARFLAEELRFDLEAALDRPAEAYAAEFTPMRCTLLQAQELRRLTVAECYPGLVTPYDLVVADLDFLELAEVAA